MWAWFIGLASLAAFVIIVLCVPFDTILILDTSAERKLRFRLVWLFGLVSRDFVQEKQKPESHQLTRAKKGGISARTMWRILSIKGLLTKITDLVRHVLCQTRIKETVVNLRIGFDDPADGGLVFAMIGAAKPFLSLPNQYALTIQPSFSDHPFVEGHLRIVLRLQPIRLILPISQFIFSVPTITMTRVLISRPWRSRI